MSNPYGEPPNPNAGPPGSPAGPPSGPPNGPGPGGYSFGPFSPQGGGPQQNPPPGGGQPNPYPAGPQPPYPGRPQPQYPGGPPPQYPGGPQPQYPGGPYGPPPTYPGAPVPGGQSPTKGRGKLWIILGAAALALILIVVAAVVALRPTPDPDPDPPYPPPTPGQSSTPSTPPAASAADAVNGYLQALAAGDAKTALSFAAVAESENPVLTGKAFARAHTALPVGNISVPPVTDPTPAEVSATYTLGKKTVNETYAVEKVGEAWKLSQVTAPMDLSGLRSYKVPVVVNGVKIKSDTVEVLPGSYEVTTGLKHLHLGKNNVFAVTGPNYQGVYYDLAPTLTKADKKAAVSAAEKSFKKCLGAHKLKPKGCPFQLSDNGYGVVESSIRWSRSGSDPFKKPRITSAGTLAYVSIKISVSLKSRCRSGTCTGTSRGQAAATVRMDRDPLKVTWL